MGRRRDPLPERLEGLGSHGLLRVELAREEHVLHGQVELAGDPDPAGAAFGGCHQHGRRRHLEAARHRLQRDIPGQDGGAQGVLAGRQLPHEERVAEDGPRIAGRLWGDVGRQQRRTVGGGGDFERRPQPARAWSVRLDVSLDAAERDRVSDRRPEELSRLRRATHHQLAEVIGGGIHELGTDRVLHGADAIALGNSELHHVLARREAGAGRQLQGRGHAVHDRLQPGIGAQAVDQPAVLVVDLVPVARRSSTRNSRIRPPRGTAAGSRDGPARAARRSPAGAAARRA